MKDGRERLRDWLDRSKLNQTQAADILGLHPVYLSQILLGKRSPGLANAIKIEDVTGISARVWTLTGVSTPDGLSPAEPGNAA